MKKLEKQLKPIMEEVLSRGTYYSNEQDQLLINGQTETHRTYFNNINSLLVSDTYKEDNRNEIIYDRRKSLEAIFIERVKFMMNERLDMVKNYLSNYGIICNTTADDLIATDCRLFLLDTYDRYICNPTCAGDCALIINSVLFNNIMSFRDLSCETNNISYKDLIEISNNILNIALIDFVHMFNLLYLEADQIYYPAGMLNKEQPEKPVAILEGEDRVKTLTEMGREDLIETDVKVGKF